MFVGKRPYMTNVRDLYFDARKDLNRDVLETLVFHVAHEYDITVRLNLISLSLILIKF
jgi:hypothetical protein